MKRVVLISSALLIMSTLLGVVILPWILQDHRTTQATIGTLSDRSKEFLAAQTSDGTSAWNTRRLNPESTQPVTTDHGVTTECFTVTIPLRLQHIKTKQDDSSCTLTATIPTPSSKLTLTARPSTKLLSENTAVTFRRHSPDHQELRPNYSFCSQQAQFRSPDSLSTFCTQNNVEYTLIFHTIARLDEAEFLELSEAILSSTTVPN